MKTNKTAFSLVELMVVIAIIGVLSAIAVPQYRDYALRAKIAEAMPLISKTNKIIAEHYSTYGTFPTEAVVAAKLNTTITSSLINIHTQYVYCLDVAPPTSTAIYYGVRFNFDVGEANRRNIYVALKDINGILVTKCGIWNIDAPAANHISDQNYLPSGCNETNVGTFYNS